MCLCPATATTKLWYCVFGLPSPGCCGVPGWSRSCPAVYRFGRVAPRPPPSERWWPHPRLRTLKSNKGWFRNSLVWVTSENESNSINANLFSERLWVLLWCIHEFRIPTCIFGLKVEETSKAEALHFPRRKNIIPVEKKALLMETFGPFQQFYTMEFLVKKKKFPILRLSFKFHHLEQLPVVILKKWP